MKLALFILVCLVCLVCLRGVALAQLSGGSVGGGDFGGVGGGGAGGGDVGGSFSDSQGAHDPGGPDSWRGILLLAGGGVLVGGFALVSRTRPRSHLFAERQGVHVSTLHVALAPAARGAVTSALRAVAYKADVSHARGRAALVHEVALLLRRHAPAAAYVAGETEQVATRRDSRTSFESRTSEARARFTEERIRNMNGEVTEPSPADADALDAAKRPGFTVVTVVLATRDEVLEPVVDRAGFTAGVNALANTLPEGLLAAEVVWMPADTAEPLSSLAVEARVPGLVRLADVVAGPVACSYCGTRYPLEDLACPRCGAYAFAQ